MDHYYVSEGMLVIQDSRSGIIAQIERTLDEDTINIICEMYESGYRDGIIDGKAEQKIKTRDSLFQLFGVERNERSDDLTAVSDYDMREEYHRILKIRKNNNQ